MKNWPEIFRVEYGEQELSHPSYHARKVSRIYWKVSH
jgi:hypothetical protein